MGPRLAFWRHSYLLLNRLGNFLCDTESERIVIAVGPCLDDKLTVDAMLVLAAARFKASVFPAQAERGGVLSECE